MDDELGESAGELILSTVVRGKRDTTADGPKDAGAGPGHALKRSKAFDPAMVLVVKD